MTQEFVSIDGSYYSNRGVDDSFPRPNVWIKEEATHTGWYTAVRHAATGDARLVASDKIRALDPTEFSRLVGLKNYLVELLKEE